MTRVPQKTTPCCQTFRKCVPLVSHGHRKYLTKRFLKSDQSLSILGRTLTWIMSLRLQRSEEHKPDYGKKERTEILS